MAETSIEWTDTVWNPTTGCDKVSPGCDNCYALTMAKRLKGMGQAKYQSDGDPRTSGPGFGLAMHPGSLEDPLRWRKPRKVFVNSMSDLFHPRVTDEFIAQVFAVMALTPQHTYQVLTKRPKRMRALLGSPEFIAEVSRQVDRRGVQAAIASMGQERIRQVYGYPGYYVTDRGRVLSSRGSDTCHWCGAEIDGSARRKFCGAECKSKAHYERRMGRWSSPSSRTEMSPDQGTQGHLRVAFVKDGTKRREFVHRLVLTTFVRPPHPGEQGCHIDGDPSNNALPNLRWGTQEDNWDDRKRHGRSQSWSRLTPDDVDDIRTSTMNTASLASRHGVSDTQIRNIRSGEQWSNETPIAWPLPGVWLGTSVEDQRRAHARVPALLDTPAAVRFLSCEPLLRPVDLVNMESEPFHYGLHWVIVGGESGKGARPMHPDWVRSLRDQCTAFGAAFFFKQWGGIRPKAGGRELDGRTWDEMPEAVVA